MEHRNVSRAAKELGVTASAASHALSRLRKALDDELFVAGASGMEPTARAFSLAPDVHDCLTRLSSVLESRAFVAEDAIRTFGIAASDYTASIIIPPLAVSLASKAPHVNLRVFPGSRMDVVRFLDEGRIDVLITWVKEVPERMCRRTVMTDDESLVVRAGHPLTSGQLTMKRLLDFPHVVVELTGSEARGADGFIDERGLSRRNWNERFLIAAGRDGKAVGRVAVMVPQYSAVVPIVERTDMIVTLPRRMALQATRDRRVVMLELPYEPLRFAIEAVWHQRAERDPGVQWLIGQMIEVMTAEDNGASSSSSPHEAPVTGGQPEPSPQDDEAMGNPAQVQKRVRQP